ncbi:MAG: transcription elongation factor GreA [Bacilli bacterium]|nr:transcription elongation factor GreA [Bacilli bacterium]
MADKKIVLTEEEHKQLTAEYRHLIDVERPDIIEKLTIARSQGDLSENADYDAARERQGQIEGRIREIEATLDNAEIIRKQSSSTIGIGDVVTFKDFSDNSEVVVKIVGNVGADPMAKPHPTVSNESPLGKALLGKVDGDSAIVEAAEPYEIQVIKFERD